MKPRPKVPEATPATRPPRAAVPGGVRVSVKMGSGVVVARGWARSLSEGGLYVETDTMLPVDAQVHLQILVREGETAHHLNIDGWVVYSNDVGVAFQFDPDSATDNPVIFRLLQNYLEPARSPDP